MSKTPRIHAAVACAVLMCSAACGRGESESPAVIGEGSALGATAVPVEVREPEAPPVPASLRLIGHFEYSAEHGGQQVRLGLGFDGERLVRYTAGAPTSTQTYRVLDEAEDHVLVELVDDAGRAVRHAYVILDDERIADDAAPEVVYVRVQVEEPDEGSGA